MANSYYVTAVATDGMRGVFLPDPPAPDVVVGYTLTQTVEAMAALTSQGYTDAQTGLIPHSLLTGA